MLVFFVKEGQNFVDVKNIYFEHFLPYQLLNIGLPSGIITVEYVQQLFKAREQLLKIYSVSELQSLCRRVIRLQQLNIKELPILLQVYCHLYPDSLDIPIIFGRFIGYRVKW